MLQSFGHLTESTTGAMVVFFIVAAMVFAIVKLSTRRLRRPYLFLAASFLAVGFCRITYFVFVGPLLIAYLLLVKPTGRGAENR